MVFEGGEGSEGLRVGEGGYECLYVCVCEDEGV
jgi:hypothetical protein